MQRHQAKRNGFEYSRISAIQTPKLIERKHIERTNEHETLGHYHIKYSPHSYPSEKQREVLYRKEEYACHIFKLCTRVLLLLTYQLKKERYSSFCSTNRKDDILSAFRFGVGFFFPSVVWVVLWLALFEALGGVLLRLGQVMVFFSFLVGVGLVFL